MTSLDQFITYFDILTSHATNLSSATVGVAACFLLSVSAADLTFSPFDA
jgi:hypothetical protein